MEFSALVLLYLVQYVCQFSPCFLGKKIKPAKTPYQTVCVQLFYFLICLTLTKMF